MTVKILQKSEKVLREIASPILIDEIKSIKIKKVIKEMKEALDSQDDGVAIAAPQIGYPLKIFIVSKRIQEILNPIKDGKFKNEQKDSKDIVFINPVMLKLSKEKMVVEEGCLSVRYLYGEVRRSKKATILAYDENGRKFQRGGSGLLSQIFQHEMDHLNGILFIDKAENVEEILPENTNKKT